MTKQEAFEIDTAFTSGPVETGGFGIFGVDSGFCYEVFSSDEFVGSEQIAHKEAAAMTRARQGW